ncbi:hypothetical protein JCM1841_003814 [Sporobolomyces salmonicolor]
MIGYIASFAAVGWGVRMYQLAIMKRNVFSNLGGHFLSAGAFAGLGYYAYHADDYQRNLIAEKKDQLLKMRERDDSLLASAAGQAAHGEHH